RLLIQSLKQVLKDTFPVDLVYRVWKNPEGQLSWLNNALKNPDIFCFADFTCRRTATECLKAQPEEENRLVSSWRSLNLIETLLNLSETGVYSSCVELFKFPLTQCPDLLILGLLQLSSLWNKLKQELISVLIPIFLGTNPNSAVILQNAWNQTYNGQLIRTIIMNAMTDWYMKSSDQEQSSRLTRILDVSQDLKALPFLLNGLPLAFNIDLACLAARRGYLKLDKWLTDRIRDLGEIMQISVQARVLFDKQQSNPLLGIQQPVSTPSGVKSLVGQSGSSLSSGQGNFDLIQQMIGLNLNQSQNPTGLNLNSFNSPTKLIMSQLNANSALQNNLLMNQTSAGLDHNKLNMITSLLNNQNRNINYSSTNPVRSSLNSPQLNMTGQEADHFYAKEIEEEVDKCIQSLFKTSTGLPSLSVDDFVNLLAKLKDSQEKKDKDFYTNALKYILIDLNINMNQLDEMQFHILSSVWGAVIERNILNQAMLNNCLKVLIQMMSKSNSTSKSFLFVLKVLDRCRSRLKDLYSFCQVLTQSTNFGDIPRPLRDYIEYGARSSMPPNYAAPQLPINQNKFLSGQQTAATLSQPRAPNAKPSIANTTNIETLLVANEADSHPKPAAPPEQIQDKIAFIFNNLSLSNMQPKGEELKDLNKDEYWQWVAHYLVVKRVSIEPNFHILYAQFVDTLKKETLNECILTETFRNIKVLLRSDKNDQKFSDRALLKNLGSWLGLITLARNRPILHKDIDLKSLIVEAFQKGPAELLFVVPFVAKVLEPAGKSKVFQPPNPWLYSIISVLVELHNEPDLKLNHKFEIEVLCKNLDIKIEQMQVKGLLRSFKIVDEQLTKAKSEAAKAVVPAAEPEPAQSQPAGYVSQTAKYKLSDIKIQSLSNNTNLIYISPDVPLLNAQPSLKSFVIPALDKAVSEMMQALLEKAVKISVSTAEPIIKKDFGLDPEESHMRLAARNMVANMSSGMMLITGKEPLTTHLFNTLKVQFSQPLAPDLANVYKDMINHACSVIVQDNIELCMCYLQKIAIQRSIIELERKLKMEFDSRLVAKSEARAHYDPTTLNYQNEKMPEQIRLKVGSISAHQFSVYEEFSKNLPGFKINTEERVAQPNFNQNDDMNMHYDNCVLAIRNEISCMPNGHFLTLNLQNLVLAIHDFKMTQQPHSASNLLKKLVSNLLEGYTLVENANDILFAKYRDCNINLLKIILNDQRFCASNWILKEVQKIWLECNQDIKYTVEGIAILFKYKLLSQQTVDLHLSQFVESGNGKALPVAHQFLRFFYIENASVHYDVQFANLLESVSRISAVSRLAQQHTELKDTIEVIRMNYEITDDVSSNARLNATALSMMYTGVQQARDFDDPDGLKEKSEQLLHEWIQHHSVLPLKENTKAFQQFVLQMNSQGLFKTDDMITRFFRICTESCVETCYMLIGKSQRAACYQRLDAFVKLIILLVKHSGDQSNHVNKINLFNKVLGLVAGCLLFDQETKTGQFEAMPFQRLFFMLLFEATLPENNLEPIIYSVLQAFVNVYHIIRPSKAPGFAYSWLELVSHRLFMSKMLQVSQPTPDQSVKSWNMYASLLSQLVKFLCPFLRNIELSQSVMLLYKGTLRLFLVLLHDFPEFLCNSHYQFCDVVPSNCIQLRNLVLSAFPRSMKLPDPLTPNLKVDMIADIDTSPPKIAFPYVYNMPHKLKSDLDSYIKSRAPISFLSELRSYLQTSPELGSKYNIQLMNALVMYVGSNGIQALRSKGLTPTHSNLAHAVHSTFIDIFQTLVADLDSEGRYLFINAIANQLRYPNSHTHYFGCVLLNLFSEANTEAIQEQITRVLLERLIVNRPHPWGLLVTFIELIKNPQFKFWDHQFVHCAPEIEK
ncbi:CCR4-NOT transcription complex subunit 1 isoform X6, partial [Brachionus plicatilis]